MFCKYGAMLAIEIVSAGNSELRPGVVAIE